MSGTIIGPALPQDAAKRRECRDLHRMAVDYLRKRDAARSEKAKVRWTLKADACQKRMDALRREDNAQDLEIRNVD